MFYIVFENIVVYWLERFSGFSAIYLACGSHSIDVLLHSLVSIQFKFVVFFIILVIHFIFKGFYVTSWWIMQHVSDTTAPTCRLVDDVLLGRRMEV